ncbi:LacI family DNA-binding transcriptional regulator [Sulfobacillus thermosulfidooxidans]|uniref:LacI family DNA-binding transcriptional regulator n=1 Tax=Sulfobacillus thermosulfidooxidans TaxID=28034 RepID=UPI000319EF84|nr:LacI family DNA-binding transcriptional regulator [Sulfobacillus thermosulfidooxidans]
MATIKDVAKMAGVSISTASLVFNHPSRVAEPTKARILEAARLLQYRPNGIARDLRVKRTDTIAVLLHDLSGPFYSELVRGVQEIADANHYTTIISHSNRQDAVGRLLYGNRVDGAIVLDPSISNTVVVDLAAQGLPIVALDRDIHHDNVVVVSADHEGGAFAATQSLISCGLRKILFLAGPEQSRDSDLRFLGYQKAMLEAGLDVVTAPLWRGDFTEQSGAFIMERILEHKTLPEAIFAANDEMALGILQVLREHTIRVPQDIAVMGFDDIRIAQYVNPKLSTVHQPMYELGLEAMRQLLRLLNGEPGDSKIILGTWLVLRDSSPGLSEH